MRLNYSKRLLSALFMVLIAGFAFAQSVLTGTVVDGDSFPITGAEVTVVGTANMAYTADDGTFSISVDAGEGMLEIVDVLSGSQQIPYSVSEGETKNLGEISLNGEGVSLASMVVVGKGIIDLEEDRKTPVAVSTVFKEEIQEKAQGNVEFPEILSNTPNVYVSNQAGGFGDSKMFTRGFDQSNTAFLLNGQPINGMEDGKMYWSNWSGMTEIANAVQIQRGLGSSKLAISSVGGTINIVTKATEKRAGGTVQGIVGNDSYWKSGISYNTGLGENGWAFSVAFSHWQAHRKWARGTFGQGQNYFLSVGKKAGAHNFNFLITGAPQLHGQNFSKSITGALSYETFGEKWNPNYGFLDGERFTWRQNYYHKPILNLNWDWDLGEDSSLSTVLYGSFGRGGGTGPLGDTKFPYGKDAEGNPIRPSIDYYRQSGYYYNELGDFNFDLLRSDNVALVEGGVGSFRHGIVRRASVNNHNWFGLVSNFNHQLSDNLSFNIGFDGRMYRGDHFRQLIDLLGLNAYSDTYQRDESLGDNVVSATFEANPWASLFSYADEGERIAYDYSENINYFGGFGQLEYATDNFSAFFQGALSTQSYKREGRWADLGESESVNKMGYNVKGGASYSLNENNIIFANAGFYSRQPFLDNIFSNVRYSNALVTPEVDNEEVTGFEAGYKYETKNLRVHINAYYTEWANRFIGTFGNDESTLLSGVTQQHRGLELDFNGKPMSNFEVRGFIAYGDWVYDGEANRRVRNEQTGEITTDDVKDLTGTKVGQAPHFNAGFGTKWDITNNLSWDADLNVFGKLYEFVNVNRVNEDYVNKKLDDYALVNTGLTYKFKFAGKSIKFRGNVRNLFNHSYINQSDQYGFFYGIGRTWNAGVSFNF